MDCYSEEKRCRGVHEETGRKTGKASHRHSPEQIKVLEEYFKQCSHPDKHAKEHLTQSLGLDQRQVQYWFQNKRTQAKIDKERENHNALKAENEKHRMENLAVKEAVKHPTCKACYDKALCQEMYENSRLKEEHKRLCEMLMPNTIGGGGGGSSFSLFDMAMVAEEGGSSSFPAKETAPKELIKFL